METHVRQDEVTDGVIRTGLLWVQLHYKLLKDLGLPIWRRPVLRTLDLWHVTGERAHSILLVEYFTPKFKYAVNEKVCVNCCHD